MNFATEALSVIIGIILGFIIGLSLVITKRKVLSSSLSQHKKIALIILSSLIRLGAVALIFAFLLLQNLISPILVGVITLSVFWIFIVLNNR